MSTRQKLNRRFEITELGGNKFQIKPFYRLYLNFPFKTGELYLTADIKVNGIKGSFNLIHTKKGNWYGVWYILHLDMYILRKLKWISHDPKIDIKTAYLYGKKHS